MLWPQKKSQTRTALPDFCLNGFRVMVRPPREEDWSAWAQLRGANRDYLKPYEPRWAENCLTRDFFARRLRRQANDWLGDRAYSFLIFSREDDALIGGINLNHVCRGAAQHAQMGYWLAEEHQGLGYMSEAARLVIKYAFQTLKLKRINASCLPDNERSVGLLQRLGFEEEGFAKAYLQIDGQWQDHRLFGLNSGAAGFGGEQPHIDTQA